MQNPIPAIKAVTTLALIQFVVAAVSACAAQNPDSIKRPEAVPALLQNMAGDWTVRQKMWSASGQVAIDLPPAVAHRKVIGNRILEEDMELAPGTKSEPFTRIAFFDYNAMTRQYEYFSIDSRAPQMMNERSYEPPRASQNEDLSLFGGIFVAPKWGNVANAAFRYRIVIGPIKQNHQLVQLYLTPVSGESGEEFLAFEYAYTREQ